MSYKRILLIDDDDCIGEVTKLTLELTTQWEVLIANSGYQGLILARTGQPDTILLDIMMPELDGLATLKELKTHSLTQDIPVLLLTAKLQATQPQQIFELGIAGIIYKPFDPLTLHNTIAKALSWL